MIDVRPARPDEAGRIAEAQLAMALETESLQLDAAIVAAGVRAVFDDPAKGTYYAACQHGQVAGVLLTTPEWSDWRNGTILWIQSVYVWPRWRRQGVFAAMYDHLREQVQASPGLIGLRLYVATGNTGAQAVYRAMGMTAEHYQLYEWIR